VSGRRTRPPPRGGRQRRRGLPPAPPPSPRGCRQRRTRSRHRCRRGPAWHPDAPACLLTTHAGAGTPSGSDACSCGRLRRRRQPRLKIGNGLPEGAFDATPYEKPVVETAKPRSRLIFDHEPVSQSSVVRHEVPFVTGIWQPGLTARVFDELVRFQAAHGQPELDLPTEKADHHHRDVAWSVPPRTRLDPDETGPVARPVADIRDIRESRLDGAGESMLTLNPEHGWRIARQNAGEGRYSIRRGRRGRAGCSGAPVALLDHAGFMKRSRLAALEGRLRRGHPCSIGRVADRWSQHGQTVSRRFHEEFCRPTLMSAVVPPRRPTQPSGNRRRLPSSITTRPVGARVFGNAA
jgi:hypothetical protein